MAITRTSWSLNTIRVGLRSSSRKFALIAALALAGCGGGGGGSPTPITPAPAETLFVPSNAWNGTTPANTETVTPDEFRRRQAAGELQVVTPDTQLTQRATYQRKVEADRTFLESKTDLSEAVMALLAESHAATTLEGQPVATLPDGRKVGLLGIGVRIEKAAEDYRLARDPANALATYELSYSLLTDALKAQVPAPATLHGSTLDQIKQAATQMNSALDTLVDIDNTRIDPDAPLTPLGSLGNSRMEKLGPGNGADNSGNCTPTGYVKRYWFPLRGFISPTKDQGERGTCWAFTAIAAVESRERVQNNNAVDLSEQFLVNKYKWEWYASDFIDGGSAAAALNAAVDRNQPLLSESGWTYNPARGRPDNAFDDGVAGTLASYTGACDGYNGWCSPSAHQGQGVCTTVLLSGFCAVSKTIFSGPGVSASRARLLWSNGTEFNFNLDLYRALLSRGVTLMASFDLYQGFTAAPGGIVSDYRKKKMVNGQLVDGTYGGHMVQIVGFISNEQLSLPGAPTSTVGGGGYFIIRNSWGCTGDGGFYYVPADYVSTMFNTLEMIDFDTRRSARWDSEQSTPGGTTGLAIDPKGTAGLDLRVQENLAKLFTVSHPLANYVRLTVTSNRDGLLYDGQWLVNAPIGGSLFANSLPVNLQTEGLRTLTITARYGSQLVSVTKDILVLNSPPTISLEGSGAPQQNENFVVNAVVADINEVNPDSICAAMAWTVSAPDTIVSGSGCVRIIRFGVAGNREVRVSSQDHEGRAGSAIVAFNVLPPPVNPYPRIATFGVYSRDFLRIENQIVGCQSNAVTNNSVLDLRQLGCKPLGINVPDRSRYFSQVGIENPAAEALSYDWTYTDYYPLPGATPRTLAARTTVSNYDLSGFLFGALSVPSVSTHTCTIDVRVNAPEASRSKTLRVWSGQCINFDAPVR